MFTLGRYKRYPDGCYAVVVGKQRGPCAYDKPTAYKRYLKSGLIASAATDKPKVRNKRRKTSLRKVRRVQAVSRSRRRSRFKVRVPVLRGHAEAL